MSFEKPNACNQCPLDWSVNRAIAEPSGFGQKLVPEVGSMAGASVNQRGSARCSKVMRSCGQLTAAAMLPTNDVTAPFLLEAMQDRYPIVRYFAANALAAQHPALPKPDYMAPAEIRNETLRSWYPHWSPEAIDSLGCALP